jgi:hypothetical protein
MTDPSGYAKTLALPAGFDAPRLLRYDDVTAHAITRDDLAADVRGINASLDLSARPAAARGRPVRSPRRRDYVDLVRHECEFPDGKSFTFCVEAEAAAISAAPTSSRVARSGWSAPQVRRQPRPRVAESDAEPSRGVELASGEEHN